MIYKILEFVQIKVLPACNHPYFIYLKNENLFNNLNTFLHRIAIFAVQQQQ